MESLKKKLEKRLHLAAHHREHSPRKIAVIPDEPSLVRIQNPSTWVPTSLPHHNVPPPPSPASVTVPVGQLLDFGELNERLPPSSSSRRPSEDPTWSWTKSDAPSAASKLLLYLPLHVQYHLLSLLPIRDLLSLAQVNRALRDLAQTEARQRGGALKMQLVWRKDFIRYMNQAFSAATRIALTRQHVFGPIWDGLFFRPHFLIVCYSPDIFEYEIRLQINATDPSAPVSHNVFNSAEAAAQDLITVKEKPTTLLNQMMRRSTGHHGGSGPVHIWHMRLFTILKPTSCTAPETHSLWSSEDLTLLFFPQNSNVSFTRGPIEYSDLMNFPMLERYYANHNMLIPIVEILNHRYQPKFLLLAMRELPEQFPPVSYTFPVIVCDISPFKACAEEFLALSGEATRIHQAILEVGDSRAVRDEKIRTLHQLSGFRTTTPVAKEAAGSSKFQVNRVYESDQSNANWLLFYLTEMWPGGTSKECPAADTTLLRDLFPGVPLLGGRGKHFVANQTMATADYGVLKRLSVPTIVTIISF